MTSAAARAISAEARPGEKGWTRLTPLAAYLVVSGVLATVLLERVTRPAGADVRDLAAPLWTMLVGIVANTSCAVLGCYLVLRRMSLLGDAISHAVLPGIVLGFLLSGSISGLPIFLGAMALGVLTSILAHGVSSLGRVSEDTSLGVVFTSLFAAGVIMIPPNADLDANCVLFGDIVTAAVDPQLIWGWEISRPLITLVPALVLIVAFVAVFWKELKIVAFDPALAAAMGVRVNVVHYLLMAMVSGATVAAFESVGSILVVAMLIVPAATAAQLTDRLGWMMAWAIAIGATSAIFGYLIAVPLATSVAGAMAVVAGVQFAAAVFFAPRQGIVSRWLRNKALAVRIAAEDVLARLYRAEESGVRGQESEVMASGRRQPAGNLQDTIIARLARWRLYRAGWTSNDGTQGNHLTNAGRTAARSLIRAHRLWETYLDTHFDLPRDHLHDAAERMEHFLGAELQAELAAELADRAVDPHGKEIPAANSISK
jgi:ABC-type Mn2+/Zn2+ transport system permease subunit